MNRAVTIVYNDHLKHACMFLHGFCGDNCVYPCISKINKLYKKTPKSWFISSGFLSIDQKCVARVMVYIPVIHFDVHSAWNMHKFHPGHMISLYVHRKRRNKFRNKIYYRYIFNKIYRDNGIRDTEIQL